MPSVWSGSYPIGTGWASGFALGLVIGIVAWVVSSNVTLGLILYVATGTALAVAFERSLDTRPLTADERRIAAALLVLGLAVGTVAAALVFL